MRPTHPALLAAVLVAAPFVAACGTNTGAGDDETPVNCDLETSADVFAVGLPKTGAAGSIKVQLMTATPAPPQRDDNTWVIQVNQLSGATVGAPLTGATIGVSSYMPLHMHFSPITPHITAMPTAGQYQIDPVNLWMPGVWETTISVSSGATTDSVVYKFCIPS